MHASEESSPTKSSEISLFMICKLWWSSEIRVSLVAPQNRESCQWTVTFAWLDAQQEVLRRSLKWGGYLGHGVMQLDEHEDLSERCLYQQYHKQVKKDGWRSLHKIHSTFYLFWPQYWWQGDLGCICSVRETLCLFAKISHLMVQFYLLWLLNFCQSFKASAHRHFCKVFVFISAPCHLHFDGLCSVFWPLVFGCSLLLFPTRFGLSMVRVLSQEVVRRRRGRWVVGVRRQCFVGADELLVTSLVSVSLPEHSRELTLKLLQLRRRKQERKSVLTSTKVHLTKSPKKNLLEPKNTS